MKYEAAEIQQNMAKDGSFLKGLRCQTGIGTGLIAGGLCFLIPGVALFIPFLGMSTVQGAFCILGMLGIPGLILTVLGFALKSRQKNGWKAYYQKTTGFSEAELEQVDRELMAPDMVTIGNRRAGEGEKAPFYYCYVTQHYFVMPLLAAGCQITRMEDIVAAAYSNEIPANYQPNSKKELWVKSGFLYLTVHDREKEPMFNGFLDAQSGGELTEEILKRNPLVIAAQKFKVGDRTYDMAKNAKEIIELQLEHRKKLSRSE